MSRAVTYYISPPPNSPIIPLAQFKLAYQIASYEDIFLESEFIPIQAWNGFYKVDFYYPKEDMGDTKVYYLRVYLADNDNYLGSWESGFPDVLPAGALPNILIEFTQKDQGGQQPVLGWNPGGEPPPPPPDEGYRVSPCPPLGDVDGDGWITQEDTKLLARYLAGQISLSEDQLTRARVRDGTGPTIQDVKVIQKYVAGLIDTFPMCGMGGEPPPPPEPPPDGMPPPPPGNGTGPNWGLLIGLGIAAAVMSKGGK